MKTEPGSELTCKAHDLDFEWEGKVIRRGIISHYASSTLTDVETVPVWLNHIAVKIDEDFNSGKINTLQKPNMTIKGNPNVTLIGEVAL